MQNPITKKSEQGFTLIELLIVVAIIGILAAIAIPQYSKYRQSAFDSAAQSELKNMHTALEGHYTAEGFEYPTSSNVGSELSFEPSDKVNIFYGNMGGGQQQFEACAYHAQGTKYYGISSNATTIQKNDCSSNPCQACATPAGTGSDSLTEMTN